MKAFNSAISLGVICHRKLQLDTQELGKLSHVLSCEACVSISNNNRRKANPAKHLFMQQITKLNRSHVLSGRDRNDPRSESIYNVFKGILATLFSGESTNPI
jgi:hypothetical protein